MKIEKKYLVFSSIGLVIFLASPCLAASQKRQSEELSKKNLEILAQSTELEKKNPEGLNQSTENPTKPPNIMLPNPEIIIKSSNTPGEPIITQGTVNVPTVPSLPRAVAPPVGDISVSNINTKPEQVNLGTKALVPRLVLRQAPAKEVLAVLARYAGLNIVFTDSPGGTSLTTVAGAPGAVNNDPTVSLDLANEPVQEVFNSVLIISGLKANRQGRTIFVGTNLPNGARNLISRTLRLNQAKANNVGIFLASQGAEFQELITPYKDITDPETNRVVRREYDAPTLQSVKGSGERTGGSPLLLTGLSVSADDRLNTVTLVGEPSQVEVATSFITQLDARRRQVAVNVKVIDLELSNNTDFGTSFSFGFGNNNYFQQDPSSPTSQAILNFGNYPTGGSILPVPSNFLLQITAQIKNGNAKIITDPTLVVQEGQEATVRVVQKVLTSVTSTFSAGSSGGVSGLITVTPVFDYAGLVVTVNIDKIDDNGFINLSVSPTIAAPYTTITFNSGVPGADNTFTLLSIRQLSSGLIRLRDNQTLIVSGIISQTDQTTISKVPILGDIPLLGALFRSTNSENKRQEVIILLTPKLLNDTSNSQFGYNYTPSPPAADLLKKQDFPISK